MGDRQDAGSGIRSGLIRRQHVIFLSMIAVGASLVATSQLIDQRLLSEGIAFIIVGFVGMLMSWTTFDIGTDIKEAIRAVGRDNQKAIESVADTNRRLVESMNNIAKSQDNIAKSQDNIAKSQDNIAKSQDNIARVLDGIKETLRRRD